MQHGNFETKICEIATKFSLISSPEVRKKGRTIETDYFTDLALCAIHAINYFFVLQKKADHQIRKTLSSEKNLPFLLNILHTTWIRFF